MANDPLNLLAVQGRANMQKSDSDAASWLPSNKAFRCQFVARQVAVKDKYRLWITRAEHDAIERILRTCPGETIPDPATTSHETTVGPPPPGAPRPDEVYLANCSEVRSAGQAPLYRGEPGYRAALDHDDDGVACER